MKSFYCCAPVLVVLTTFLSPVFTQQGLYQSQVWGVCQGHEYEIGCGDGKGDRVLNVTKIVATFTVIADAIQCKDGLHCIATIGTADGTNVANPALNGILTQARTECQGRPVCKVRLPSYNQVMWNPDHETEESNCGLFFDEEYLSLVNVVATCVDAGTIQPISSPEETTTTELLREPTTTQPISSAEELTTTGLPNEPIETTNASTTTNTTTPVAISSKATKITTEPKIPQGPTTPHRLHQLPDRTLIIIIVCTIVGVGVLVAVVAALYIMFRRAMSKEVHLAPSAPTEHDMIEYGMPPMEKQQPATEQNMVERDTK